MGRRSGMNRQEQADIRSHYYRDVLYGHCFGVKVLTLIANDSLEKLIQDLGQFISQRIKTYLTKSSKNQDHDFDMRFLQEHKIFRYFPEITDAEERMIILIALVPHLQPNFFESIILEQLPTGGDFPEFGGVKASN